MTVPVIVHGSERAHRVGGGLNCLAASRLFILMASCCGALLSGPGRWRGCLCAPLLRIPYASHYGFYDGDTRGRSSVLTAELRSESLPANTKQANSMSLPLHTRIHMRRGWMWRTRSLCARVSAAADARPSSPLEGVVHRHGKACLRGTREGGGEVWRNAACRPRASQEMRGASTRQLRITSAHTHVRARLDIYAPLRVRGRVRVTHRFACPACMVWLTLLSPTPTFCARSSSWSLFLSSEPHGPPAICHTAALGRLLALTHSANPSSCSVRACSRFRVALRGCAGSLTPPLFLLSASSSALSVFRECGDVSCQ